MIKCILQWRISKFLLMMSPVFTFLFPAITSAGDGSAQPFSAIDCTKLKAALNEAGWRAELSSQGDILLRPGNNDSGSTNVAASSTAEKPVPLITGLQVALGSRGWQVEQSSQGDIVLWPPGKSQVAGNAGDTSLAVMPTLALDVLRVALGDRGWKVEQSENGEVLLWPPEEKVIAETSPGTDDKAFSFIRAALAGQVWQVETHSAGDIYLLPRDFAAEANTMATASAKIAMTQAAEVLVDKDGDQVPDEVDLCPGSQSGSKVTRTGCEMDEYIVLEGVNFRSGSADLLDDAKPILDVQAARLLKFPGLKFKVIGHTDSSGSDGLNLALSKQRAETVMDYLSAKNVDHKNMTAFGSGESEPVADNGTEQGRARNRRVEIHLEE